MRSLGAGLSRLRSALSDPATRCRVSLTAMLGASVGIGAARNSPWVVEGVVLLGATVVASIAVVGVAVRQVVDIGVLTPSREQYAKSTLVLAIGAPAALVLTAIYLPWAGISPAPVRGFMLGATAALLGWFVLALAVRPTEEIDAIFDDGAAASPTEGLPLPPGSLGALAEFNTNPEDPFGQDLLNRAQFAEGLCAEILAAEGPTLWALDGPWGSGKTAVVQMSSAHLRRGDVEVVVFTPPVEGLTGNAWADLVAAVGGRLAVPRQETDHATSGWRPWRDVARHLADPRLALNERTASVAAPGALLEKARCLLNDHVATSGHRLVVWIDELDRCEPQYAVKSLQAARALLNVGGVTTMVAIHRAGLENGIATIYGPPGGRFLDRYIDRTIPLEPPEKHLYARHEARTAMVTECAKRLRPEDPRLGAWHLLAATSLLVDLSLRDLQQIVAEFFAVTASLPPLEEYQFGGDERHPGAEQDPLFEARRRRARTDAAVLGLLVLRRYSPSGFADVATKAEGAEQTPAKWRDLLLAAGADRVPVGDNTMDHTGSIIEGLDAALRRDQPLGGTFRCLVAAVNSQPSPYSDILAGSPED